MRDVTWQPEIVSLISWLPAGLCYSILNLHSGSRMVSLKKPTKITFTVTHLEFIGICFVLYLTASSYFQKLFLSYQVDQEHNKLLFEVFDENRLVRLCFI